MEIWAFVYGVLTLAGGIMGYIKAGSQVSLISGGLSGLIILGSALLYVQQKPLGYYGLLGISAVLSVFFGMRFCNQTIGVTRIANNKDNSVMSSDFSNRFSLFDKNFSIVGE